MDTADVAPIQAELKQKMEQAYRFTSEDFAGLRTGRAVPRMLENIQVDYYGTHTPLSQLGSITAPETQLLVVQVYDASIVKAVEKAIVSAGLGLSPNTEGTTLRIPVPVLTEERRKLLIRQVRKMGEEHKVAVRNIRREANDKMKRLEKDKRISQDELHQLEGEIQAETDRFIASIDALIKDKEKELMQV